MRGAAAPAAREWRLRQYLSALLTLATVITLLVVGSGLLSLRIPELERANTALVHQEAQVFAAREQLLLGSTEKRLELLARALHPLNDADATALLDAAVEVDDTVRSVFITSPGGTVRLAGLHPQDRSTRSDLVGSDLSRSSLFTAFQQRGTTTWSAKYLSSLSGRVTVGVALGLADRRVLIAEIPLGALLGSATPTLLVHDNHDTPRAHIWLVDGNGEVLADSDQGRAVGRMNLREHPALKPAPPPDAATPPLRWVGPDGVRYHLASVHLPQLDWHFIARVPAGLDSPGIRVTVLMVAGAFVGTLLIGLALAPFWARHLSRQLDLIVTRALQAARGEPAPDWPRGRLRELNHLSSILQDMARTLQEREQKIQAIFNMAPVPMLVTDASDQPHLLEANDAWCQRFGYERAAVAGRAGADLGLWEDTDQRSLAIAQAVRTSMSVEARLRNAQGEIVLCRVSTQRVVAADRALLVWSMEDLTELRRNEQALKALNADLESRVAQRTEALSRSHAQLLEAMGHLQQTRDDLVRSEKMAALGSLVAGVAHELNTPLGNSLMATSTLRDELGGFQASMKEGLRRAALDRLLAQVDQATRITERNIMRALDLVTSFKQVAVDQASSQRRTFLLHEVVQEILLTLKPMLKRTPFDVQVDVPEDLHLDSFPGPLGQVLTNLITNALQHGLEERDHGCVRIAAARSGPHRLQLRVSDNGRGIAPGLLPRVFDPFVTTRMGRGGTGLGLNIAYNIAGTVLGGTLDVQSTVGEGTTFTLDLPDSAPVNGNTEPPALPA